MRILGEIENRPRRVRRCFYPERAGTLLILHCGPPTRLRRFGEVDCERSARQPSPVEEALGS